MRLRILLEGKSYEVAVEILPESVDQAETESVVDVPESVLLPPRITDIRPEDRICRSPIAGVVVSIIATDHQRIRQDEAVLVIEAMKMQTTIGAPVDGTVDGIEVRPGDAVKPGQVLCKIA